VLRAVISDDLQELSSSWDGRPFGHNRHGPKIGGGTPFLGRGRRAPSNTMSPEPRPTFVPSCIMVHQPFGQNRHGPKIGGGGCAPFLERELRPHLTQKSPGPRPTSVPSSILIHPAVWPHRTWAENCGWGYRQLPSSNTMWPAEAYLHACQVSSWSVQPFGHYTPTLQTGHDRTTVR